MLWGMPFLLVCTLLFMMVSYWVIGFHHGTHVLFRLLTFLPCDPVEENQILITALVHLLVTALEIGAIVKARSLWLFWLHSFHCMEERYAFESLTNWHKFKSSWAGIHPTGRVCLFHIRDKSRVKKRLPIQQDGKGNDQSDASD
ncbi:hypothetical protein C8R45DRAFT_948483 [Mycena sanguinolenta]|nr:hypothetical protein C8R45DRAFT_948483 [Mycena sanguinolenta]